MSLIFQSFHVHSQRTLNSHKTDRFCGDFFILKIVLLHDSTNQRCYAVHSHCIFVLQPNVQDEDGNTPLHLACTESNVAVVKMLLEAGADVTLTDIDDETPLVRACFAKSVELVELLLKAGSDPNFPEGRPLEIVVRAPSLESLKLLIAAGAEVSRNTYLSFASEHNYLDMMKVSGTALHCE